MGYKFPKGDLSRSPFFLAIYQARYLIALFASSPNVTERLAQLREIHKIETTIISPELVTLEKKKTQYDPANLAFLIHDVARLMRTGYDQKMKPLGLTRSQWWVLAYLQREDGLTQQELADILDIGKVTLAGLLVRLEQKGWVERRPDTYDKRAKRVYLTDKVDATIDAMRSVGIELLDDIVSALSVKERDALESALQHMRQSLVELSMSPESKNRRAQAKGLKATARRSRGVGG